MPLVPDAFVTLFAAEAAGIANPVNPLLEPHQIAEILEAANTKILVALGPMPGTDIWQKIEQVRGKLKNLKAIVQVHGAGDPANGIHSFNELIKAQPSDRLVSGRKISGSDIAAYFHTGGTTGTPKLVRHTHTNQVYQAWVLNLMLKSQPGNNLLFGMPLYHVGGSLSQVLTQLSAGGSLVVLSPSGWRNPNAVKNIWALVDRYKPQTLSSVPTVLAASLTIPPGNADISSLQICRGRRLGDPRRRRTSDHGQAEAAGARSLRHDRDVERAHHRVSGPADPARLGRARGALQPRAHRQDGQRGQL